MSTHIPPLRSGSVHLQPDQLRTMSGNAEREGGDGWAPVSVYRSRAVARRVRRRRMLLADVAVGLALALIAIVLAPGLAIIAMIAVIVLLGCGVSMVRVPRRKRARRRPASSHQSR